MSSNKRALAGSHALEVATKIVQILRESGVRTQICGSIRRECETVNDIDMVVSAPLRRAIEVMAKAMEDGKIAAVLVSNLENVTKTCDFVVEGGIQLNMYAAEEENWGAMTLFLTGSKLFNILMRGEAKKQGYRLNQYGLWHGDDLIAGKTEELIFLALGLEWVEPKERSMYGPPSQIERKVRKEVR